MIEANKNSDFFFFSPLFFLLFPEESDTERDKLTEELDEVTEELGERDKKIEEITEELAERTARINELTTELGERDTKIDELSAEIEKRDRKIDELTAELEEYKAKMRKCIAEHSKCIFLPSTNTPFAFGFKFTMPLITYFLLCLFREGGRKNG
ncbi:uncharacterized protein ACIBXB_005553 [Morphnus guianensis]